MTENIMSVIKTNMNYLTNTEKKIGMIILDDPIAFISYSIQELAKKADVSQGSIINFSRKFVHGGFTDLKLQIAAAVPGDSIAIPDVVENSDSISEALDRMIEVRKASFELTRQVNLEKAWKSAVDKILAAKKVEIYGIFQSATVATSLCYQLMQLGIAVSFVSDILTCAISAAMLDEDSLVIAISSSGKTKDILDAVKNAKSNNVPIIAITSNINSPLAKMADDTLIAASAGGTIETYATQNLIADTICAYIKNNLKPEDKNKYFNLNRILNSHSVEETEDEAIG